MNDRTRRRRGQGPEPNTLSGGVAPNTMKGIGPPDRSAGPPARGGAPERRSLLDRLQARLGEKATTALLFGVPAVVITAVAWLVTGDGGQALIAGIGGSLLLMVGLMGAAEGSARR